MDTEAIETEDHSYDQVITKCLSSKRTNKFLKLILLKQSHMQLKAIPASLPASQSPRKSSDILRESTLSASTSTNIHMPSIAVTPSTTLEDENNEEQIEIFQKPTIKVGPIRSDIRRKSADPTEPIYSNV